ncbi:MAG: aspartate aminotransferase family protein [Candidatus Bathyarchaeia archaeon]
MPLSREEIIQIENSHLVNSYNRRGIVAVSGKGAVIWDLNGKEYIDCMAGYGTCTVGHSNDRVIRAIQEQARKLLSCHISLYNDARAELIEKIIEVVPKGLNRVFFSNSGSEAVEAAIKMARRHTGRREIISTMRAYHGKTMGALSATWDSKYRAPFMPLLPNFKFVPYGRADRVREAITNDTAAVIVEPVQGEGGVYVAPDGYLKELREITEEKDVLLIFDEVQTGFGRTGRFFACEHWGVTPDLLCLAKAGGSGIPIGITVGTESVTSSLKVGEHTSTFGGNPLQCAAASATIDVIREERLWEKAETLGNHFMELLRGLVGKYRIAREVRGLGLMIGFELRFDVMGIIRRMMEEGVIILDAGVNIIRFLPPCVITREQLSTVAEKLELCLAEEENKRLG